MRYDASVNVIHAHLRAAEYAQNSSRADPVTAASPKGAKPLRRELREQNVKAQTANETAAAADSNPPSATSRETS